MATLPKTIAAPVKAHRPANAQPATARRYSVARQPRVLSVSEAKTHLLAVLTDIETKGERITITRRGKPIAQIVPIVEVPHVSGFGSMKGTVTITGDIVSPDPAAWGVEP